MTIPTNNDSVDTELFTSRDLSWLEFNRRVLDEAGNEANPVLERLKFIAISDSNLDEFFMVRVATLTRQASGSGDIADPAGLKPSRQLPRIANTVKSMQKTQSRLLNGILGELANGGIKISSMALLSEEERNLTTGKFRREILPVLTPLAIDAAHPFPLLASGAIEIAVVFKSPDNEEIRAFVEVPQQLERFVEVSSQDGKRKFVMLEDLISSNLGMLFPAGEIVDSLACRITRDMNLNISDNNTADLMQSIGAQLRLRKRRGAIRLEIAGHRKGKLVKWLRKSLHLDESACYEPDAPLCLRQFWEIVEKTARPEWLENEWKPAPLAALAGHGMVFEAIRTEGEILVAPPFHSFSTIVRMLEEAADDPNVLAIKQTLYRVSGNSPVVHALLKAAERGKQVSVVVELKARFDEYNNIAWAMELERYGAHVVYGVAGLKVHAKAMLVIRREGDRLMRYAHLGTGNYNDKTAAVYADVGILSCDEDICDDVSRLFNLLTGVTMPGISFTTMAVSPFSLRSTFEHLVEREISNARSGLPARIIAKMNSLSDEKMIRLLHIAAESGVEITLIVRGLCCLRPPRNSCNVRVLSIIDRYLEHSRIYFFENGGDGEFFLSSADMMTRNLDRRIEALFPVKSDKTKSALKTMLEFQIGDSCKCHRLTADGDYLAPRNGDKDSRSQYRTWKYFVDSAKGELYSGNSGTLKVFKSEKRDGVPPEASR
ncbi:MAG: polyphosphate kinase 1 [Victivallaceae bacterium]|nr:polyphosphate kinase 1 [Victivallaceae bacterium]